VGRINRRWRWLASKRRLRKVAIELHRLKGTVWAVKQLLRNFGANIVLREWRQTAPSGPPHTFLNLAGQDGVPASAVLVDAVIAVVHRVIGRDYLDSGSVASLNRETEAPGWAMEMETGRTCKVGYTVGF